MAASKVLGEETVNGDNTYLVVLRPRYQPTVSIYRHAHIAGLQLSPGDSNPVEARTELLCY